VGSLPLIHAAMQQNTYEQKMAKDALPLHENRQLFEKQYELLKHELDLVSNAIRQQDEITKSVKNWAIVTWTASIGLSVSQTQLHTYLWLTAVIPFLFWLVDGTFRRIQRTFIVRFSDIAEYLNGQSFAQSAQSGSALDFPLMQMRSRKKYTNGDWRHWRKNSLVGVMMFKSVGFLYIGLILVSLLMWAVLLFRSTDATQSGA
jgi:hypothetical protein